MGTRSYSGLAELSRSSSSSAESGARVPPTLVSRGGTVGSPRHTNRSLVRVLGFLVQRTSTTAHLCPWSSVMIREGIMLKNHTSNGSAPKGSPLGGRAPVSHQKHGMPIEYQTSIPSVYRTMCPWCYKCLGRAISTVETELRKWYTRHVSRARSSQWR